MKDVIAGPRVEWLGDVGPHQFEARLVSEVIQVCGSSREQVIHSYYGIAFAQERVAKMGTKKSCPAGNNHSHVLHP